MTIVPPISADQAYRHTIAIHCPGCDEMEMAARCDLAALRDAASAGMAHELASNTAAVVLGEVVHLATHGVYAPLPASKLIRLRSSLSFLMEAARFIERFHRDL